MDDATIEMTIHWQGVDLRHPLDGSSDGWGTFTTSRGTFVLRSAGGRFHATPMDAGNPGPSSDTAIHTGAGLILNGQTVGLIRTDGTWRGTAHISGHLVHIEDPRP